jgi:hypothetical protein
LRRRESIGPQEFFVTNFQIVVFSSSKRNINESQVLSCAPTSQ